MTNQVLEQIIEFAPRPRKARMYETMDVYSAGTTALYTQPKPFGSDIGQIPGLPSSPISPVVIPYGNQTGLGGDVHDTFKIDRYNNHYGGHTSIKIPGYDPFRLPW